jgi:hypothetical protein
VEQQSAREFRATNLYYLAQAAVLAVMALFVSLLIFNYAYARMPMGQALATIYNSYNAGPLFAGLLGAHWIYPAAKCLLVVGAGVWALARLRRQDAAAALPLYALAGLLLVDMVVPLVYVVRSTIFMLQSVQANLAPILGQSVRLLFYFVASLVLFVVMLRAASSTAKHLAGEAREPEAPRKPISGLGGWMILGTIRSIFMPLNFAYSLAIAVGGYAGVRSLLAGPEAYINMELVLLIALGLALSVGAVIALFKKRFAFKPLIISAEALTLLVNGLTLTYMLTRASSQYLAHTGYYGGAMITTLVTIVASAVFIVYYSKSDRVKNTFQKELWPAEPGVG